MVVALDVDPGGDHSLHHFGAQILIVIRGRNREVTLFHARTVAKIVCLPRRIPPALFRIDKIKAVLRRAVEVHIIEDKEFRFRSEIRRIRDAGFFQVSLGPLRDPARIAEGAGPYHLRAPYLHEEVVVPIEMDRHSRAGTGDERDQVVLHGRLSTRPERKLEA